MVRMMFSIEKKDKHWLQAKSQAMGISMAEIIRRSIQYQMRSPTFTCHKDQK